MQDTTIHIPPGYKLTEVGVIPHDWESAPMSELFDFKNGLNKEKQYFGYGTPIVNYMDVYKNRGLRGSYIKGKVSLSQNELKAYQVKKGDVFFTRTSETTDEIGISSVMLEDLKFTTFSGFVLRARPKTDRLNIEYNQYCYSSIVTRKQIVSSATYTTRALTNGRVLGKVNLVFPKSKQEQQSIATALTDIDNLISELDTLIIKKQAIKQGAMQQLLTGKKRLPGFSGEREETTLGDICEKVTTGKLDANAMVENGEYRFYTCAREYSYIDTYAFDCEALLVSGNGANVGYIHYYKGKFNAYQRTYVLSGFSEDVIFIKLYLDRYLKDRIDSEVNSGNTPYIKMNTLTDMIINMPNTVKEQQAIASFLSDMDNDIQNTITQRDKYKSLKQGMMQQLLTGKIRLI